MDKFHHADLLQSDYTTVEVVFDDFFEPDNLDDTPSQDGRAYTYKANILLNLQVGDRVVVHAQNRLAIARITQVHQAPKIQANTHYRYKWVVDKVDLTAFAKRHEEETLIDEMMARIEFEQARQTLMDKVDKLRQDSDELNTKYQTLNALKKLFMPSR